MIRRPHGNDWLLIAQADHAHLAAEIARAWGNQQVPALPLADQLLPAIRDHDEGWRGWEQSPEIDPASGLPRDFTEMPMRTAAAIWSESILCCAAGLPSIAAATTQFERFLEMRGLRFTRERAAVLETVLSFRHGFQIDELEEIIGEGRHSRATGYRTCRLLVEAGILVESVDRSLTAAIYRQGASPLGGIWVSRHFCYLAEKARESRSGDSEDVAAIDRFLSLQAELQEGWTSDSLRGFAGNELPRVIETGFRYVQFFDHVSLWLCCAERTEAVDLRLPGGGNFRLEPKSAEAIAIDPWPLNTASLDLSVSARRIPARRYEQDEFQEAIAVAPVERLDWTLCR